MSQLNNRIKMLKKQLHKVNKPNDELTIFKAYINGEVDLDERIFLNDVLGKLFENEFNHSLTDIDAIRYTELFTDEQMDQIQDIVLKFYGTINLNLLTSDELMYLLEASIKVCSKDHIKPKAVIPYSLYVKSELFDQDELEKIKDMYMKIRANVES